VSEEFSIAGAARGEPLPRGRVGARVRVPLSGMPSPRWSRLFAGHLTASLMGHPAVGHLRVGELVQGCEIVLDGVEAPEAPQLGLAVREAVAAANRGAAHEAAPAAAGNMDQAHADQIAAGLRLGEPVPVAAGAAGA
jgi:hypothetical protein